MFFIYNFLAVMMYFLAGAVCVAGHWGVSIGLGLGGVIFSGLYVWELLDDYEKTHKR